MAQAPASSADSLTDVVVIGGGIVGLAITAALAERGVSVLLMSTQRAGAASRAAAGLLVPHVAGHGRPAPAWSAFTTAARNLYPDYVRWVNDRSDVQVPFDASGAIELARSADDLAALEAAAPRGAQRLTSRAVASLEPALAPAAGGILYPVDGAVDNVTLTDALASIVARHSRVRLLEEAAARISLERSSPAVFGTSGTRAESERIILAAGAWSGALAGLPRPVPVRPLRGQICVVRTAPLRRVVLTPDVYMVGRGGDRTLVGSTMEDVGFDAGTSPEMLDALRRAAAAACPALANAPVVASWSGLRPATPDLLPILGPDPDYPALIYACGHSRNGILLAPITAAATCSVVLHRTPAWDLSPWSIERFRQGRPE